MCNGGVCLPPDGHSAWAYTLLPSRTSRSFWEQKKCEPNRWHFKPLNQLLLSQTSCK